jgi:hypothetical protein
MTVGNALACFIPAKEEVEQFAKNGFGCEQCEYPSEGVCDAPEHTCENPFASNLDARSQRVKGNAKWREQRCREIAACWQPRFGKLLWQKSAFVKTQYRLRNGNLDGPKKERHDELFVGIGKAKHWWMPR